MSDNTAPAIQTVQRAAVILNAFTVGRPRLTLAELTEALHSTKGTAYRYAKALRETGLLQYDSDTATYTLGPQLLSLESVARSGLSIIAAAESKMQNLLKELDRTIILSVWDGETAAVVRCVDNTSGVIRLSIKPGSRLDLFESAQGRVFCAYLNSSEIPSLDRHLRASPRFQDELDVIRAGGISKNSPTVHGVRTIAAPVFEYRRITACLAVVGTAIAVAEEREEQIVSSLRTAAMSLSADVGTPAEEWPIQPTP